MNRRLLIGACALFVLCAFGPGDTATPVIGGTGRLCWLLADLAAILAILRGADLSRLVLDNPWLSAWPALAMLSAVWSLAPAVSLYHGAQLAMTILMGPLILTALSLADVLLALALGLAAAGALSWIALAGNAPGAVKAEGAWAGVFPHKNLLGETMSLEVFTCAALVWSGRHRLFALAAGLSAAALLLGSRSGTSLLSLAVAAALLPILLIFGRGLRAFGTGLGLLLAAAGGAAALVADGGVFEAVLGGLGKDDTLSGRTTLWQFGIDQIRSSPILGVGYQSYWESAVTSAAYLRYVIGQDLWFFHDNFIDVGVAFGAVGLAVFTVGLAACAWRVVGAFRRAPGPLAAWRVMFVAYAFVEATAENPLFQNHSVPQTLLALAAASPAIAPAPARAARARGAALTPAGAHR